MKRKHMDHIAAKRYVGSFHYGLVQKPVSFQEAMKIAEAKAAVDKELETSKNVAAWDTKVRSKSDHLKNAEIAKHF